MFENVVVHTYYYTTHFWIFVGVSKKKQQTTLLGGIAFASLTETSPNRRRLFRRMSSGRTQTDTSGEPQAPSFAKEVKKGDIPKDFVTSSRFFDINFALVQGVPPRKS